MLPRLDAGERLAAIDDRAVAAGNVERSDRVRMIRRLEETARGSMRKPAKPSPAVLRGMGIGIVTPASEASEKAQNDG